MNNLTDQTRMRLHLLLIPAACLLTLLACTTPPENSPLPILGNRTVVNGDTIYPTIPDFSFVDQDSQTVTNETFRDKAYIVDFFFIHCPTICPKVKANGLRVYEKYKNDDRIMLLSHSIDTRNDTVPALRRHAEKLGIRSDKWHLVTGDKDAIYRIADDYFSVAIENPDAPGGFDHSGRLILVDKNRHVRAFCDGTDNKDVDRFMKDVDRLLSEF
ncbi:MAG: SCO family protein [Saprospiraceae bacterium]|nr:SCO family protein [Saprospiraceae bacterium]